MHNSKLIRSMIDYLNNFKIPLLRGILFLIFLLVFQFATVEVLQAQIEAQDTSGTDINFSSSLKLSQINQFGDFSIQDALSRYPGIQVERDGSINLRGVGLNRYNVTLDGQNLSNSGLGNRNFDLSGISSNLLQNLEIKRVVTPDMNANALSGVINLQSSNRNISGRRIEGSFGGGALTNYAGRVSPGTKVLGSYSERFLDDLTVSLTISYEDAQDVSEQLETEFATFDFGNGLVDVIERVSPGLEVNEYSRLGSVLNVKYAPDDTRGYFLRGFYNNSNSTEVFHQNSWSANGDWIRPDTTGATGEIGSFSHKASNNKREINTLAVNTGGWINSDVFDIDYSVGWSQSSSNHTSYLFPFEFNEVDYQINMENRFRPTMDITTRNVQIQDNGEVDQRFLFGQNFDRVIEDHINNKLTAKVDVEYPFELGSIKFGAQALLSFKDGEYDENSFEYNRTLRMISFNTLREPNRNVDIFGDAYRIPWLLKTEDAILFLESQRPLFDGDENLRRSQSEIKNYGVNEYIYSGYGMSKLSFGKVGIIGGLRAEYTISSYTGNIVDFDEAGDYVGASEQSFDKNSLRLFPNLQLFANINSSSSLQLAYSETIDRPSYYFIVPFQRTNNADSTIFSGNPDLDPTTAQNFDAVFKKSFNGSDLVSIGGFYKILTDFVVVSEQEISTGINDGFTKTTFNNSSAEATIYGVEVAVSKKLDFLPGLLSNLGTHANYTWSSSTYDSRADEETAYPGQSPHVVNAALYYQQNRFFAQVAYQWTSEYISQLAEDQQFAPSVNSSVYLDRYENGFQDLSVNLEYQLSEQFQAWANVYNILSNETIEYAYEKRFYPTKQYQTNGLGLSLGVRFDFK